MRLAKKFSAFGLDYRFIKEDDLYLLFKYRNDIHIKHFFGDKGELSLNVIRFWYKRIENSTTTIPYMVEKDKKELAYMEIKNIDYDKKESEFGIYIFNADNYGSGISEKIALCWDIILKKLNISTSYSRIYEKNIRSIKFFEKIGGVFDRYDGNYIILKHDYKNESKVMINIATKLNVLDEYDNLINSNLIMHM